MSKNFLLWSLLCAGVQSNSARMSLATRTIMIKSTELCRSGTTYNKEALAVLERVYKLFIKKYGRETNVKFFALLSKLEAQGIDPEEIEFMGEFAEDDDDILLDLIEDED